MKHELTSTQVIDLPCRRQGGYRARRSPGEKFPAEFIRSIRAALNREARLANRAGVPLRDGIAQAWIAPARGCLPK